MKSIFYKLLIPILLGVATMTSCRKENPELESPETYIGGNFETIFESYWNGMNNNYIFWDIEKTDWDAVYKQYKPLFAKLNINDSTDVSIARGYFKEMSKDLIDGHYNLTLNLPQLEEGSIFINPSFERKILDSAYHDPIRMGHFLNAIPNNYLDEKAEVVALKILNPDFTNSTKRIVTGTIKRDILYLGFDEFALAKYANKFRTYRNALESFFSKLKDSTLKGVIIDVRSNGGGNLSDLDFLVGRMISSPLQIGYTRSKVNNGRLDYTPWVPALVAPQKDGQKVTCPIVMLADAHSVSMSEITTMAIKSLPNGYFVGERTWGGTGPLSTNIYYNGGQFDVAGNLLPYGLNVYTSSLMFKYKDGKVYEGVGFSPDVEVKFNGAAIAAQQDPQLQKAIDLIGSLDNKSLRSENPR
ncbi:S41 family peptidase [Sphingobacterium sp.]|uniref:S41 family peptidase n=1 Tax=Sphingobacterium sp. TaxID=341027 RepID=UPI0031D68884